MRNFILVNITICFRDSLLYMYIMCWMSSCLMLYFRILSTKLLYLHLLVFLGLRNLSSSSWIFTSSGSKSLPFYLIGIRLVLEQVRLMAESNPFKFLFFSGYHSSLSISHFFFFLQISKSQLQSKLC